MTNHPPSVLWHCWLGHQTCKNIISEMNCTVSSGMLSLTQLNSVEWIVVKLSEKLMWWCLWCSAVTYMFLKTSNAPPSASSSNANGTGDRLIDAVSYNSLW